MSVATQAGQRRADVLDHAGRAAQEGVVDRSGRDDVTQHQPRLIAIEPAIQNRHVLLLLAQHRKTDKRPR